MFNPFFINSNSCYSDKDIITIDEFARNCSGNTGNSYISYAMINHLYKGFTKVDEIKSIYTYDFSQMDKDIEYINAFCSHVILILQDQIRITESYGQEIPFENIIIFLKKIKKPIIITSLGANSFTGYDSNFYKQLDPRRVRFFQELSSLTESVGVRGNFTIEVLNQLGIFNAEAVGCPSFFETGPNRTIVKKDFNDDFKLALAGSYYNIKNLHHFQRSYILQDELELIEALYFDSTKFLNKEGNGYRFGLFNLDMEAYCQGNYISFVSIVEWKNYLKNFTFLLGTRVHGAIAALNAGIPAVILNGDSRAQEMCELFDVPYHPKLLQEEIDIEKVYAMCDYSCMNKNYNYLYNNYIKWLKTNHLDFTQQNNSTEFITQPSFVLNNLKILSQFGDSKKTQDLYQQTQDLYQQTQDLYQQTQDLYQQIQDLGLRIENLIHFKTFIKVLILKYIRIIKMFLQSIVNITKKKIN